MALAAVLAVDRGAARAKRRGDCGKRRAVLQRRDVAEQRRNVLVGIFPAFLRARRLRRLLAYVRDGGLRAPRDGPRGKGRQGRGARNRGRRRRLASVAGRAGAELVRRETAEQARVRHVG